MKSVLPNAKFWIPSEDEWYKAAYYDPTSGVYFDYSDRNRYALPYSATTPASLNTPDDTNVANFYNERRHRPTATTTATR